MSIGTNPYVRQPGPKPSTARPAAPSRGPDGLADVLERVLDKGIVIAGDIQINLLDIELITIKVRLLVASADTAQQMGIDWWKHDPFLTAKDRELSQENAVLRDRVDQLEAAMGRKLVEGEPSPGDLVGEGAQEPMATRGQPSPTGAAAGGGSRESNGDGGHAEQDPQVRTVGVDEVYLQHAAGGPVLRVEAVPEDDPEQAKEAEVSEDAGEESDEADLSELTKAELQEQLREYELPVSGNKQELTDRLEEARSDRGDDD